MSPITESELLERANGLANKTLGQLATMLNEPIPIKTTQAKGWAGQLLERYLGATAGCQSLPDFTHLNIELKTLPIKNNKPAESTYICHVPLLNPELMWQQSCVYRKLARVLWMPIEGDPITPLSQRRIGSAILWSPDREQAKILQQDWEELMEYVSLGRIDEISARYGTYLQIRPKAANSSARRLAIGSEGNLVSTLPRGFYLRASFTRRICF